MPEEKGTEECGTCAFWEKIFGKAAGGICLMRRSAQQDSCPQWASLNILKDGGPLQSLWRMVSTKPGR